MTDFQALSGRQGRQFAEQCDTLLDGLGYRLEGRLLLPEIGVEIDQSTVSPGGRHVWFEYKGSVQGSRPGLLRTDTLKKAVANGALLRGHTEIGVFVVLTSHLPDRGSGLGMLTTALRLGYLDDAICIYDPAQQRRLTAL
jgi:hypothetical protein